MGGLLLNDFPQPVGLSSGLDYHDLSLLPACLNPFRAARLQGPLYRRRRRNRVIATTVDRCCRNLWAAAFVEYAGTVGGCATVDAGHFDGFVWWVRLQYCLKPQNVRRGDVR